jgi:hypothetical protein
VLLNSLVGLLGRLLVDWLSVACWFDWLLVCLVTTLLAWTVDSY